MNVNPSSEVADSIGEFSERWNEVHAQTFLGNEFQGRVTAAIGDDAAFNLIPPEEGGYMLISLGHGTAWPQPCGLIYFDVGGSRYLDKYFGTTLLKIEPIDTVLTGTTGIDGSTNVSAVNGSLWIENRRGASYIHRFTFFG